MSKAEERAYECFPNEDIESKKARFGFLLGYQQAEKDLLENKHEKSWRLDEKLWEGIKDIEEASYQYTYDASNDWAYDIPTWDDVQDAFKAGSEWKEGLELTWEDIESIHTLMAHQEVAPILWKCGNEAFYQEVLKRFKAKKNDTTK